MLKPKMTLAASLLMLSVSASAACSSTTYPDAGTYPDGAIIGCANGGPACGVGLMCCAGVPYDLQGQCELSCNARSDRNLKQDFAPVDGNAMLERLARLQVSSWSYRSEPGVRHMGPMAQDFRAAFGLGSDDRVIQMVDANGVTVAAIQALYQRVQRLEQTTASLTNENRELRQRVGALEAH